MACTGIHSVGPSLPSVYPSSLYDSPLRILLPLSPFYFAFWRPASKHSVVCGGQKQHVILWVRGPSHPSLPPSEHTHFLHRACREIYWCDDLKMRREIVVWVWYWIDDIHCTLCISLSLQLSVCLSFSVISLFHSIGVLCCKTSSSGFIREGIWRATGGKQDDLNIAVFRHEHGSIWMLCVGYCRRWLCYPTPPTCTSHCSTLFLSITHSFHVTVIFPYIYLSPLSLPPFFFFCWSPSRAHYIMQRRLTFRSAHWNRTVCGWGMDGLDILYEWHSTICQ